MSAHFNNTDILAANRAPFSGRDFVALFRRDLSRRGDRRRGDGT